MNDGAGVGEGGRGKGGLVELGGFGIGRFGIGACAVWERGALGMLFRVW